MLNRTNIDLYAFSNLDNQKKLEFFVTLANLAPSSHNMQPWFFRIEKDAIVVVPNPKLKLKVADPHGREFYITLGTVVGGLKIIFNSYGIKYDLTLSKDLNKEIARFNFTNLEPNNIDFELLKAYINRHNSRLPFETKELPKDFTAKIDNYAKGIAELQLITNPDLKSKIKLNILDSVEKAFSNKSFCNELAPWVKTSVGHHEDGLPGYNLGMPFVVSLIFPFMIRNMNISKLQVKIHKKMLDNSSTFAILSSSEESPTKWLSIGELFIKIAVEAEKNNISIGVMQASIENPKNRRELKEILKLEQYPQMFFRFGFCKLLHKHSPRRPLNKILV